MRWTPLSVKSFSTISDEARVFLNIICKRNWDSSLESCLHKSELPITPGLVNDVLKSISEPKLALRLFLWAGKQPNYVHSSDSIQIISVIWGHAKHFDAFLQISDQYEKLGLGLGLGLKLGLRNRGMQPGGSIMS